jgi:hypothetical protein
MEEQAQEQTHSVFSSKASNDYHFKTGQCDMPPGHGTSGVPVTHWRSTEFGRESGGPGNLQGGKGAPRAPAESPGFLERIQNDRVFLKRLKMA